MPFPFTFLPVLSDRGAALLSPHVVYETDIIHHSVKCFPSRSLIFWGFFLLLVFFFPLKRGCKFPGLNTSSMVCLNPYYSLNCVKWSQ